MNKRITVPVLLLLLACLSGFAEASEKSSAKLAARALMPKIEILSLPKRSYTFAALNYPRNTEWTGLFLNSNASWLQKVNVRSSATKVDSCYEGKVPAQILTISSRSLPVCLLRGLPSGKRGFVSRYYPRGRKNPSPTGPRSGFTIKIKGAGKSTYLFKAVEKDNFVSYVLSRGKKEQLLKKLEIDPVVGGDGMPRRDQLILWAGDLDADGKADFLTAFNTRAGEGISMQLYLSTRAKSHEIVGLAAEFDYWPPDNPGC
ncbi:MAG: hypothetical protein K2X27_11030 [Candidatus Obscuribacterales bacterium]|nr:hypothetical protein [Candidatus Obscuribacterales bacterium]